jgi:hypothetical protein
MVVAFSFIQREVNFLPDNIHYIFNIHPTTTIMGIDTINAINVFGGTEPSPYSIDWETTSMLFNVILYLMIGPYLLLMGYKKSRAHPNRAKPWYWFIGGMICLGSFAIIPVEMIHVKVFENTKERAEESRVRDMMRAELFDVGLATAQYEILENELDETFEIEDLDMDNLEYDYSVKGISSDTLVTIVVSNPEIPDFNTQVNVRPYEKELIDWRN